MLVLELVGTCLQCKEACEKAVAIDPEAIYCQDSRGLYRALTGDYKGAIEDFEYYVKGAQGKKSERRIRKRESWIIELKANKNPFDPATLRELKYE